MTKLTIVTRKKTELNYESEKVDELKYYVWDWIEKKPLRHNDIKSNPKLKIFNLPHQNETVFENETPKKNFKFLTGI